MGGYRQTSDSERIVGSVGVIFPLFPPTLMLRNLSLSSQGLALTVLMALQSMASCRVREKTLLKGCGSIRQISFLKVQSKV